MVSKGHLELSRSSNALNAAWPTSQPPHEHTEARTWGVRLCMCCLGVEFLRYSEPTVRFRIVTHGPRFCCMTAAPRFTRSHDLLIFIILKRAPSAVPQLAAASFCPVSVDFVSLVRRCSVA